LEETLTRFARPLLWDVGFEKEPDNLPSPKSLGQFATRGLFFMGSAFHRFRRGRKTNNAVNATSPSKAIASAKIGV